MDDKKAIISNRTVTQNLYKDGENVWDIVDELKKAISEISVLKTEIQSMQKDIEQIRKYTQIEYF